MTRLANGSDLPDSTAVRVRYAAALSMTVGLLQVSIRFAFMLFVTILLVNNILKMTEAVQLQKEVHG